MGDRGNRGDKGSKKWIQRLVNKKPELLNSQIKRNLNLAKDEDIRWLSPLEDDEYAEYCDQHFIELLCVKLENTPLRDFWPLRDPT